MICGGDNGQHGTFLGQPCRGTSEGVTANLTRTIQQYSEAAQIAELERMYRLIPSAKRIRWESMH